MKRNIYLSFLGLLAFGACTKTITYNLSDIPNDFAGLPPLPADSGIQLHIPAFPIPANFEREVFIRKDLNNPTDIYVNKIRSVGRAGTHHFVLSSMTESPNFPMPPADVMIDQNNMDGSFNLLSSTNRDAILYEAQNSDYTLELPAGYALRLAPNTKLMTNPHYFNKTDKVRFGEVYCNIYTQPKSSVIHVLENGESDGNATLILPPNKETTLTNDFIMEKKTEIIVMTPHYHQRGKKFEVQIIGGARNGEVILESYDYQHPVLANFINKPLILEKGEGLRTIVTYNNESSRTIKYGVTSEDEMNFLFYYYQNI
jgi:Copper type II ascorbate-dependent monooxygenase, C-terminal domain